MGKLATYALIGLLWLLHWLPLRWLAAMGWGLGGLLHKLAGSRRRVALRNVELCFPQMPLAEREALVKEHFGWLGRSLLERGLLWFASAQRLQRLMKVEGNMKLSEQVDRSVMWLMPHFVGLDWVGPAIMLNQAKPGCSIYQRQSNALFDAALRRARSRFGTVKLADRHEGVRSILRYIRDGYGFLNLPDMDFGPKDSAFVPFFGVPANTLLAPAKIAQTMKMVVQPVVVTMLPKGEGIRIMAYDALENFPSGDLEGDARRFNEWLEARILENPAQYFWVHKRFKTRPEGEPSLYQR